MGSRGRPPKPAQDRRTSQPKIPLTAVELKVWKACAAHDTEDNLSRWIRGIIWDHVMYEARRGWLPEDDEAAQEVMRRKRN
jgi:hypothetical protein